MNVMVKLAMVVAALLFVTNMAFAFPPCDEEVCYNVIYTDESGSSHPEGWRACLLDNGTGQLNGFLDLALFGGGPINPSFNLVPGWQTWILHAPTFSGYIWMAADGIFLFAQGYNSAASVRWIAQGNKRPCL